MSAFTAAEIEYLASQRLGRLATVGRDDQPHVSPVTFVYNPDEDTIDIGGMRFGEGKKWRDVAHNPKVCLIVDESWGSGAKGIEIRGVAERHETGGESINPRFPQFTPQFFRIRPTRLVAWGIDRTEDDPYARNARDVG
jgi:pyridoxamine 5'-phosphate oxidase family protein